MARRHKIKTKMKVRFWWEIYRTLLTTPKLREALGLDHSWDKTRFLYRRWGDVRRMHFNDWWKVHGYLFHDRQPAVRLIKRNRFKLKPRCIYLELNLKKTPTSIMHLVRFYLRSKAEELKRGKNKTEVQTIFAFTPQAEIRPAPYVDYVRFLKEVYAPNCTRRAIELRKIAQERFQGKRRTIPSLHLDKRKDREPIAYISISRYRKKAIGLCRAVARGEFPGSDR